jgi:hypothetical protein
VIDDPRTLAAMDDLRAAQARAASALERREHAPEHARAAMRATLAEATAALEQLADLVPEEEPDLPAAVGTYLGADGSVWRHDGHWRRLDAADVPIGFGAPEVPEAARPLKPLAEAVRELASPPPPGLYANRYGAVWRVEDGRRIVQLATSIGGSPLIRDLPGALVEVRTGRAYSAADVRLLEIG